MGFIKGVHHIALKCDSSENFEKTVSFYKDVLGMTIVRSWGEGAGAGIMLDTGNALMEIFASGKAEEKTGPVPHFALATDDVDGCLKVIQDAGYSVKMNPTDICIPANPPYPAKIAFAIGPVGEEIELFCEK